LKVFVEVHLKTLSEWSADSHFAEMGDEKAHSTLTD
jgi:hypothetical protein